MTQINPDLAAAAHMARTRLMPIIERACPFPKGSAGWLAWYHGLQFGLSVAHAMATEAAEETVQ
jgi:hypothetical protein